MMSALPSLTRLFAREPAPSESLVEPLAAIYDGGLTFPAHENGRPWTIANFVATLDGVISFDEPGQQGGGPISGENAADHALMGILRAYADAVIFGAGSLRSDAGHVRTPSFIYPLLAEAYARQRAAMGKREPEPLSVVVSASGDVPLAEPTFSTAGVRALIATTTRGRNRITAAQLSSSTQLRTLPATPDGGVDPQALMRLLWDEFGVRIALHEGGPRLLGAWVRAALLDELFLTLAPQLAGRTSASTRPALLEGIAFPAGAAPWSTLESLHRTDSHLFLRYRRQPSR